MSSLSALPALKVKTPLERQKEVMTLRDMMQQGQYRQELMTGQQQQNQENQMKLEKQQRDMAEDKLVMDTLRQGVTLGEAAKRLRDQVSPERISALEERHLKTIAYTDALESHKKAQLSKKLEEAALDATRILDLPDDELMRRAPEVFRKFGMNWPGGAAEAPIDRGFSMSPSDIARMGGVPGETNDRGFLMPPPDAAARLGGVPGETNDRIYRPAPGGSGSARQGVSTLSPDQVRQILQASMVSTQALKTYLDQGETRAKTRKANAEAWAKENPTVTPVPGRDVPYPPAVEAQRTRMRPAAGGGGHLSTAQQDIKDTAQAIMEGQAVPVLTNYSFRDRTAIMGELKRAGYNQARAEQDWKATQKHLATLNGAQQERLRQAVTFTYDSLDVIENLYGEWKQVGGVSGLKILNKANLAAAKQMGGKAGATAQALEAQINDLTAELGTVYKGGNSSTDESLRLAAQNLKGDWNEETFRKALGLIRTNLRLRKNSIMSSEAVGVSEGSPYAPQQSGQQGGGQQTGGDFFSQFGGGKRANGR